MAKHPICDRIGDPHLNSLKLLRKQLSDLLLESGEHFLPVADHSEASLFEDICVGVFVNCDNDLSFGAARHMLAGSTRCLAPR